MRKNRSRKYISCRPRHIPSAVVVIHTGEVPLSRPCLVASAEFFPRDLEAIRPISAILPWCSSASAGAWSRWEPRGVPDLRRAMLDTDFVLMVLLQSCILVQNTRRIAGIHTIMNPVVSSMTDHIIESMLSTLTREASRGSISVVNECVMLQINDSKPHRYKNNYISCLNSYASLKTASVCLWWLAGTLGGESITSRLRPRLRSCVG